MSVKCMPRYLTGVDAGTVLTAAQLSLVSTAGGGVLSVELVNIVFTGWRYTLCRFKNPLVRSTTGIISFLSVAEMAQSSKYICAGNAVSP